MSSDESNPPTGYLSEESKRTYTTWAGITGAIFFLLQFILPFGVMFAVMPMMMFGSNMFRDTDIDGAVFWRDRIYFVERTFGAHNAAEPSAVLKSLALGPDAEPETVIELPLREPTLLAAPNEIWLVGESQVARFDGSTLQSEAHDEVLGSTSPPFFWRGELAVIEETPSSFGLRVFRNGGWDYDVLEGIDDDDSDEDCCRFRILELGGVTHAFLYKDETIYHRRLGTDAEWTVAAKADWRWQVTAVGRQPTLFTFRRGDDFERKLIGWRQGDDGWKRFFEIELKSSSSFGVVATGKEDQFVVLSSTMPGSFVVRQVTGGKVTGRWAHGSSFPFPMPFMLLMMIPYATMLALPLLMALVLSRLMRRHRNKMHTAGEQTAEMASVWRRALAQLTDMVLVGLPLGAVSIFMMSNITDPEMMLGPNMFFIWIAGMFGSLAFGVICLFVIAWLEGAYGVTPGKWIAGIRVLGTDLKPCGFGRAIIRNLLKFVDGMFNFMVGILLIALTENWQRLGDMAARTVVVRVDRPRSQ